MHPKFYLRKIFWKGCKRGGFTYISPDHFRITFTSKWHRKFTPKKITRKHGIWCQRGPKMEPESMPNPIKNQCQNLQRKRARKSSRNHVSLKVESLKFIAKQLFLMIQKVAYTNRKDAPQNQMKLKPSPQSMKARYKYYARKKDTQHIKK